MLRLNVARIILLLLLALLIAAVLVVVTAKQTQSKDVYNFPYLVREISPQSSRHVIEQSIIAPYTTAKDALVKAGILVYKEDIIEMFPEMVPGVGGVIVLDRAPEITIQDGKKTKLVRSRLTRLSDVITEQGIPEIGRDDKITPNIDAETVHGMTVTIVRVRKTTLVQKEKIAFKTIEKEDANWERGKTKVTQEGKSGVKEYSYEVTREDGEEVSRVLVKTEITTIKEDRIIVKGTKLIFGRTQEGKASWYRSRYQAASNVLPRGTKVLVTNPKTGKSREIIIEDHMASKEKIIDLHPDIFVSLGASLDQGIQGVVVKEVLN